jgi:hypothetical protein
VPRKKLCFVGTIALLVHLRVMVSSRIGSLAESRDQVLAPWRQDSQDTLISLISTKRIDHHESP